MQQQIADAIHEYWASVESLDPRRYRENFASDATLEDPVGTNNIQGAEAIAAFFRDGIQAWNIDRVAPAIQHVIVGTGQSTEAAVAWELTVHREAGQCMVIQGIGFFKFKPNHADGRLLLESVREFWTPQTMTPKLEVG